MRTALAAVTVLIRTMTGRGGRVPKRKSGSRIRNPTRLRLIPSGRDLLPNTPEPSRRSILDCCGRLRDCDLEMSLGSSLGYEQPATFWRRASTVNTHGDKYTQPEVAIAQTP